MKRVFVTGIIILLLSTACTNQYKVPSDIIPKDKMEKVLWDMILADRYANNFLSKDSTKNMKKETFTMYAQVFSIHKITDDEFLKSFKFYLNRPDIAQVMLDSLAAKANRRRDEMYKPSPQ